MKGIYTALVKTFSTTLVWIILFSPLYAQLGSKDTPKEIDDSKENYVFEDSITESNYRYYVKIVITSSYEKISIMIKDEREIDKPYLESRGGIFAVSTIEQDLRSKLEIDLINKTLSNCLSPFYFSYLSTNNSSKKLPSSINFDRTINQKNSCLLGGSLEITLRLRNNPDIISSIKSLVDKKDSTAQEKILSSIVTAYHEITGHPLVYKIVDPDAQILDEPISEHLGEELILWNDKKTDKTINPNTVKIGELPIRIQYSAYFPIEFRKIEK